MSNYLNSFSVPLWKIINELGQKNRNIVFEGAQGSMLDIDFGTYPYVTSSNTISVSYTHLTLPTKVYV